MTEKDQWFLAELERQRQYLWYVKCLTITSLFLLGCLTGMLIFSWYYEPEPPWKVLIITAGWLLIVLGADSSAYQIKQRIKRLEEIVE